jgi:5'-nucleotidase
MRDCLRVLVLILSILLTSSLAFADKDNGVDFRLTILHNNDGESQLINAGAGLEDFGGVARFATVVRKEKIKAVFGKGNRSDEDDRGLKKGVITLTSGDNFLAGPEFNASLEKGVPFYDTIALDLVGYDAMCLGNHDFDFGPDVTADFIRGFRRKVTFLSANLDFSNEPALDALAKKKRIAASVVIKVRGEKIGVIGATTEDLRFISSPRSVIINEVLPAIEAEIEKLEAKGVDKMILISHLQSIQEDLDLIPQLRGIDVAIAGGGDELLANEDDLLIPGEEGSVFGPYPIVAVDLEGKSVPVVTTNGNYKYLGRLVVTFDTDGEVVDIDPTSGPIRVAGGNNPDAVRPAPFVQKLVVEPVEDALASLGANIIGDSEVALDGVRGNVRTIETNLGNLIADSLKWQATQLAPAFGAPEPNVALQNGGGIRNDDVRGPGDITELDTFDILPFSNFVTLVPNISRDQFKEIMENAVSKVESVSGRFAQVSGFTMEYDPAGTPQTLDDDGNVVTPGSRIISITLSNGTAIVTSGAVVAGDPLTIATIDFLANGGDQYPYRGAPFTRLGVTYQQALSNYIQDGLFGIIKEGDYPQGGEGRITLAP